MNVVCAPPRGFVIEFAVFLFRCLVVSEEREENNGMALVWSGVAWRGVAWRGMAWRGVVAWCVYGQAMAYLAMHRPNPDEPFPDLQDPTIYPSHPRARNAVPLLNWDVLFEIGVKAKLWKSPHAVGHVDQVRACVRACVRAFVRAYLFCERASVCACHTFLSKSAESCNHAGPHSVRSSNVAAADVTLSFLLLLDLFARRAYAPSW